MATMNTTSTWAYEVNQYFNKKALLTIDNNSILDKYGDFENMPMNNTRTMMFERYGNFPELGELTEGITPDGMTLSKSNITAYLRQYGGLTIVTDVMEKTLLKKTFPVMHDRLNEAGVRTRDILIRDTLYTSTLHYCADDTAGNKINTSYDGTTTANVNGGFTSDNTLAIFQDLFDAKAQQFTELIVGSNKVLSNPLGASYIAIVPTQAVTQLYKLDDFVKVEKYADPSKRLPFEIGYMNNIRFVVSHNFTSVGTGANGKPVYTAVIMGKHAYATLKLGGKGL
ncbi:MAG: N4-gp56 family major capsid protein, partial [Deltaproteobacteria bacterium]